MVKNGFGVLCFSVFVASIGAGILIPVLPIYVNKLSASGFILGAFFSSYFLSMAICMPFIGRLSDKIGKKLFITGGLAFTAIIAMAYVRVSTPYQLIAVRLLNGISIAMILPTIMAYVGELIPKGQEGSYMGIYSMTIFLGIAAGPVLGGAIVDWGGAEPAFYACAGATGIAFLITLFFLPLHAPGGTPAISKSPIQEIFASGPLKGLLIFGFILNMAQSSLMIFLPLLANNQNLSMFQIGILASAVIIFAGLLQVPFGRLANHWNKGKLVIASTLLVAVGLVFLPLTKGFLALLILGSLIGMACALGAPAANAMMIEYSREIGLGVVTGLMNASYSVGNIIGPLAAGIAMDMINIDYSFYLIAACFIIGTILFYLFAKEAIMPSHIAAARIKRGNPEVHEGPLP